MRPIFLVFFIIPLILLVQTAHAQTTELLPHAEQGVIEVIFDRQGDTNVKHTLKPSSTITELMLIPGDVSDISFADQTQQPIMTTKYGHNYLTILASRSDTIITYKLNEFATFTNNSWKADFRYPATTTFAFPQEVDLVFVNNDPLYFENGEGFNCHGCQISIEYHIDEPKKHIPVSWEEHEFVVEVRTFAEINEFEFDQPAKEIRLNANLDDKFVTFIIPSDLLGGPYVALDNGEMVPILDQISNETHTWLGVRPNSTSSSILTIVGTTVIPEFSTIIPLIVGGLLAILTVSQIKKGSLLTTRAT